MRFSDGCSAVYPGARRVGHDVRQMSAEPMLLKALAATLDNLAICVIIVADENRILYANQAGVQMFANDGPVRSVNGRLSSRNAAANDQLARAIALARKSKAEIGATGISVALGSPYNAPAIAHVLPLADGDLRTQLVPEATAAVFIVPSVGRPIVDLAGVADVLGLTPSEARLVEKLAAGATLAEAAVALGIADTTAKTHLTHIFCKTGVSPSGADGAHPAPDPANTKASRGLRR
jgi:DNA-binding CsgD family transcriptional regulator